MLLLEALLNIFSVIYLVPLSSCVSVSNLYKMMILQQLSISSFYKRTLYISKLLFLLYSPN